IKMMRVLLTRPLQRIADHNTFSSILKSDSIDVVEIPMITIAYPSDTRSLDDAIARLAQKDFDYCVLSSPTAVEYFHARAEDLGLANSIRTSVGFSTVGARSGEKLVALGYTLAIPLPSENAGAASLLTSLRTFDIRNKKTLILQSQIGMA